MTLRNHPTDRDAPCVVEPPTEGDYEVWTYEGGAVVMSFSSPDREVAHKAFRRTKVAAAFVRGSAVLAGNLDVSSKVLATIKRLIADAKHAAPPAAEPAAPPRKRCARPGCLSPVSFTADSGLCSPHEQARLAQERRDARRDELAPIPTPPSRTPAPAPVVITPEPERATPPAVEATTTPTPAEESMSKPPTCSKCKKHPTDAVTKRTPEGTEDWCRHCRRTEAAARNGKRLGGGVTQASPKKRAAKAPRGNLGQALAKVQRHAAVIEALGGIETAESLAQIAGELGGGGEVVQALSNLRDLA